MANKQKGPSKLIVRPQGVCTSRTCARSLAWLACHALCARHVVVCRPEPLLLTAVCLGANVGHSLREGRSHLAYRACEEEEGQLRMGRISRAVAALGLGSGLTAGVLLATTGAAFADYGPGAAYQVEISANTNNLIVIGGKSNGSGGGLWFWAALTPTSSSGGTVDYQEDDCIHGVPMAPNGDTHNALSTTYTVSGGTLTIEKVATGAGPVDITVPSTDGHYVYPDSSFPLLFGGSVFSLLPAQVQVAP